jgi:hypothetical protein
VTEFIVEQVPAPEDRFVIVTNDFARGRLPVPGLKALDRVLLLHLISLPTGWRMTRDQLDASVEEGIVAVKQALKRLEVTGYLKRDQRRDTRGRWVWTWRVTRDPIARPLSPPPPENHPMDATSGNTPSPQVAPSTGNPPTENRPISTEHGELQKTDENTDLQDGPPGGAPAGARAGIKGYQLVGEDPKALTRKLVAVWSAVVTENGGILPVLDSGYWDPEGEGRTGREQHPAGRQIKSWVGAYPHPTVSELDTALDQIRAHARKWAEHNSKDAERATA